MTYKTRTDHKTAHAELELQTAYIGAGDKKSVFTQTGEWHGYKVFFRTEVDKHGEGKTAFGIKGKPQCDLLHFYR